MLAPVSKLNSIFLFSLLLTLFFFTTCKEKEEGCTDITASNWNAAADKPCESCCTYPELEFLFEHVYGDTTFNYGDPFPDVSGNIYTIASIRYYISDVRLSNSSDQFMVTDTITMEIYADGVKKDTLVSNDFILATKATSSATIGSFRADGQSIENVAFTLGISNPINKSDPTSLPTSHPLAPKLDSMYWDMDQGFIFQRIEIVPDTNTVGRDTIILEIGGDDVLHAISLPYFATMTSGFNVTIPIKVDYQTWFTGINFVDDDPVVWKDSIVSNIAKSFSISE